MSNRHNWKTDKERFPEGCRHQTCVRCGSERREVVEETVTVSNRGGTWRKRKIWGYVVEGGDLSPAKLNYPKKVPSCE